MVHVTMLNSSKSHFVSAVRRGFSLVELLAVMTIIAILLSLASVGVSNIGKGQGVTSGLSLAEGLLSQARSLAINNNATARLIIHNDLNDAIPEESKRYRRMMMVVYKVLDEEGSEVDEWIRAGNPVFLPDSVYFSANLSLTDMRGGDQIPTDTHQLTSQVADSHQCFIYEFNGQGILTTPGAGFVLESGPRPPGEPNPIIRKEKDVGGFAILKNGSTTLIRDITQFGPIGR